MMTSRAGESRTVGQRLDPVGRAWITACLTCLTFLTFRREESVGEESGQLSQLKRSRSDRRARTDQAPPTRPLLAFPQAPAALFRLADYARRSEGGRPSKGTSSRSEPDIALSPARPKLLLSQLGVRRHVAGIGQIRLRRPNDFARGIRWR
jgi:hypothetical protein